MEHDAKPLRRPATFDVIDLANLIRDRFRVVLIYTSLCVVLSIVYIWTADSFYRSEIVLTPAAEDVAPNPAQVLAGSLGSLSGLIGSSPQNQVSQTLAILESRSFTLDFLTNNDALHRLLPEYWNAEDQQWKPIRPGPLSRLLIAIKFREPRRSEETFRRDEALRRFGLLRTVNFEEASQLVRITIEWTDPVVAANWANAMAVQLNEVARKREIEESTKNIKYLREEIENTNLVGVKNALFGLLENEVRSSMVANVRREFALQVIDPAVPADRPYRPKPLLVLFLAGFGGALIGVLHLLLSEYLRFLAHSKANND